MDINQPTIPQQRVVLKDILYNILFVIAIVAMIMLAVNQGLGMYYKEKFLMTPCEFCAEINTKQAMCVEDCFSMVEVRTPDGKGGWRYQTFNTRRTNVSAWIANETSQQFKIQNYSFDFATP